jgi:hypothetical protein
LLIAASRVAIFEDHGLDTLRHYQAVRLWRAQFRERRVLTLSTVNEGERTTTCDFEVA